MFWAGGDSLLVGPPVTGADSVVPGEGDLHRRHGARQHRGRRARGSGLSGLSVSPGGKWIVALVVQAGRGFWQVFDRSGKVADQVINSCTCPGRITSDALWLTRSGVGFESIVRLGHRSRHRPSRRRGRTPCSRGNFNNFSVTADGSTLVLDDGTAEFALWALGFPEALQGKFAEPSAGSKSSTRVGAQLSPDGTAHPHGPRICRRLPDRASGASRCFPSRGEPRRRSVRRSDSRGSRLDRLGDRRGDVPAGARVCTSAWSMCAPAAPVRTFDIPDSLARDFAPLPDGWAWMPSTTDRIVVERGGKTDRDSPNPPWFGEVVGCDRRSVRHRLAYSSAGTPAPTTRSASPWSRCDGGTPVLLGHCRWRSAASARFLGDGSILFAPLGHARVDHASTGCRPRQGRTARQGAALRRWTSPCPTTSSAPPCSRPITTAMPT